ncbi:hypothetical protein EDD86DRAFT_187051 [Gorgonomyces haynaldii]|nr:hypothetical protein EDD86DRAFT_187051 [Gorgonomyces haynaldii]
MGPKTPLKQKPRQVLPNIGTGPLRIQVEQSAPVAEPHQQHLDTDSGHAYIQQIWSTFSTLSDSDRNKLLKGLLSRSSNSQIQMVCTCLNLKNVESNTFSSRVVPEEVYGKYLVIQKKQQPVVRQEQADPYKTMANAIANTKTFEDPDEFLNSNIYIKLLNSTMDSQTVIKQIAKSGPNAMKFLVNFLSERCRRFQGMLNAIHSIAMEIENSRAIERLFQNILETTDAKFCTIYYLNPTSKQVSISNTNWPENRSNLTQDHIYGMKSILQGEMVNVCNLRSSDGFNNLIVEHYSAVGAECVISAPIYGDGMTVMGLIELVNKNSGNPFFNAEDEFMMKVLSGFGTLLSNHAHATQMSSKKQDDIKAFLNTASHLDADADMGDLVHVIMGTARELVTAERCTLFMIDKENQQLWSRVAQGSGEIRLPMSQAGIAGFVATTGEILNIEDAYQDSRFNRSFDIKTGFRTRNILATPMLNSKGEIIGVFQAINKIPDTVSFTKDDVNQITSFSALAASTIEKSLEFQAMQSDLDNFTQSTVFLKGILQTLPSSVLAVGPDGRLKYINNADLFEFGSNVSMMKLTSYQHWLGADNPRLVDEINKVITTNYHTSGTNCKLVVKGASEPRYVNYHIAPIRYSEQMDQERIRPKSAKQKPTQQENNGILLFLQDTSPEASMIEALGRQLDHTTIDMIKDTPMMLEGIEARMTVMCCDIRGFSSLIPEIGPQRTVQYLNCFHQAVSDAVKSHNGVVIQLTGDAAICVFGAPISKEDDAVQATRAAMVLQQSMEDVNFTLQGMSLPAMKIGIALTTGDAIYGAIGAQSNLQFQVFGEPLKVAGDLQQLGSEYGSQIVIDPITRELIKERFYIRQLDTATIRSTGTPMVLYDVYGATEMTLKHDTMTTMICFELGINEYKLKNWQAAIMHFKKCIALSDDPPSRAFTDRCKGFIEGRFEAPEEWDGVWRPEYKISHF